MLVFEFMSFWSTKVTGTRAGHLNGVLSVRYPSASLSLAVNHSPFSFPTLISRVFVATR